MPQGKLERGFGPWPPFGQERKLLQMLQQLV
jgi:hypothetical protein